MIDIKIAAASLNQTPIDWKKNYKNIINSIEDAKSKNVKILCLPELCISGYGCQDLFFNDWVIKKSFKILEKIVPICSEILVVIGLPLKFKNYIYNASCIIKNSKIIGFALKSNLPNDGVHYEKRWFKSWKIGKREKIKINNKTYPIGNIKVEYNKKLDIGFEICRDAWDEERPINYLKTKKKLLILNPVGSHFAFGKYKFWKELIIKTSKKYNCTYLSCNLLGNESGKVIYDGHVIAAHNGKLIGENKRFSFRDYNLYIIDKKNYKKLDYENHYEEFFDATSLALFDYKRKSNCEGFVLSISGGLDSSIVAIMVSEMIKRAIKNIGLDLFINRFKLKLNKIEYKKIIKLKKKQLYKELTKKILITAYQKSKNSTSKTLEAAKSISNFIGSKFYLWNIDNEVKSVTEKIEKVLKQKITWKKNNLTKQNIQSRMRSPMIWMLANMYNSLLLSTSNRSESAVGYATMDGDTSGSIAPIAGINKTFIKNTIKYAYQKLEYTCLKKVLELKPSAELLPKKMNQNDENELMPYTLMSKIERLAIKKSNSPTEIFKELSKSKEFRNDDLKKFIKKFFILFSKNQWKRERYAPSFHFDDFSLDPNSWYRFPILSGNYGEELEVL